MKRVQSTLLQLEQLLSKIPVWGSVIGIFLFNFILKMAFIGSYSIWCDECYTIYHTQASLSQIIDLSTVDSSPPGFLLIINLWEQLFGQSVTALRAFSAICSSLCGVLIFLFAKRFLSMRTAVVTILLFAFSNVQMIYAQEARAYALVCLLSIGSLYLFFLLTLEGKKSRWLMFSFGLVNATLLYFHYVTIFLLLAELIVMVLCFRKWQIWKSYLISQTIGALLFLPWLKFVFSANAPGSLWLLPPDGWKSVEELFVVFFATKKIFAAFCLVVVSVMLYYTATVWGKTEEVVRRKLWMLFLLVVLPVGLCYLVSTYYTAVFLHRYLLYVSLISILLLAYAVSLDHWNKYFRGGIIVSLIIASYLSLSLRPYKYENWQGTATFLKEKVRKGDAVVLSAAYLFHCFSYYYDPESFQHYLQTEKDMAAKDVFVTNNAETARSLDLSKYKRIFLVRAHDAVVDPNNTLLTDFQAKYQQKSQQQFDAVWVFEFETK